MKKVGLAIESISSLKVFGPLLFRMFHHDLGPVVLIPTRRKGKQYDHIRSADLIRVFPELELADIVEYEPGAFVPAVEAQHLTEVCVLNAYRNFAQVAVNLAQRGVEVYELDYFANSVYVAASNDDQAVVWAALSALSARFVTSDWWRELELAVQPEHHRFRDRFESLGTPVVDVAATLDEDKARHSLSLPEEQRIVTLFTPNIRDHQTYYFYGLAGRYRLRKLAEILRQYCAERGYFLVVKSREKQWTPEPFVAVADQFIEDVPGMLYPSTSAWLIAASSLTIHFGSMMVLESVAAGVPALGIEVEAIDKLHGYMRPEARVIVRQQVLSGEPNSLFNFPSVSESIPLRVEAKQFATVADRMIESADVKLGEYNVYNERFSGWRPQDSPTDRILAYLANGRSTDHDQQPAELAARKKVAAS